MMTSSQGNGLQLHFSQWPNNLEDTIPWSSSRFSAWGGCRPVLADWDVEGAILRFIRGACPARQRGRGGCDEAAAVAQRCVEAVLHLAQRCLWTKKMFYDVISYFENYIWPLLYHSCLLPTKIKWYCNWT